MNLLNDINIIKLSTARNAAGSTGRSKVVDMAGFEGCVFILEGTTLLNGTTGSVLGNQKATLYVAQSSAAAGTYRRCVAYAASSSGLAAGVNKRILALDVYRPTKRYLRATVKGASSAGMYTILGIQYGSRRPGSSALQGSTTVTGYAIAVSPTTA